MYVTVQDYGHRTAFHQLEAQDTAPTVTAQYQAFFNISSKRTICTRRFPVTVSSTGEDGRMLASHCRKARTIRRLQAPKVASGTWWTTYLSCCKHHGSDAVSGLTDW